MKRIAFVSPLPPAASGVADYAADVLALLADHYTIDVFHGEETPDLARLPRSCRVFPAAALAPRHREAPYHAAVHQMGNAPAHAFVYEAAARVPGLLVLHDLVLHHSRARVFLDGPEVRAYAADPADLALRRSAAAAISRYEAEVAYAYPDEGRRLARVHLDTVGDLLPYAFPLFRLPVEASRLVAVHNQAMAEAIAEEVPSAECALVPMPVTPVPVPAEEIARLRSRYAIDAGDFVVGVFGLVTREKRLDTVIRAVARVAVGHPRVRLIVVGPIPDPEAVRRRLAELGAGERTVVTGRVPFGELPAHIALADAAVHLRYPTARETSAALLRVLAQGRPTVMADLDNFAEIPDDAVLRADLTDEEGAVTRGLLRLVERPSLRARLAERARSYVERAHAPARCLDAYVQAIERTAGVPDPPPRPWPAHWTPAAT